MSSTKAALKSAKAALDAGKYEDAIGHVKKVLTIDPNNYHAYVGIFFETWACSQTDYHLFFAAMFFLD